MIFVTLGTQDKEFTRLLEAIDREIEKGNIKERVVVQAGYTKYESKNMEIFDLIPTDEFNKYIKSADLIITHGGAGSILTAIKNNKKVIAAARLYKYKEHTNDHQKQIVKEFADEGYILELRDFNKLGKLIEKSKSFTPKKFVSNTPNMIKLIEDYIEDTNNVSWYNKYKEALLYLFFGVCTTLVNLVTKWILLLTVIDSSNAIQLQAAIIISWIVSVLFAYVTNRKYVFDSKNEDKLKEFSSFVGARLVTLIMDMIIMYVGVTLMRGNDKIIKLISQVVVIVSNYLFSKIFVFRRN